MPLLSEETLGEGLTKTERQGNLLKLDRLTGREGKRILVESWDKLCDIEKGKAVSLPQKSDLYFPQTVLHVILIR